MTVRVDPENPHSLKQQKVEEAPKPIWGDWFEEFVNTDGKEFKSKYGYQITDIPFYKYYSNVEINSHVEEIVRKNIDMLGRIKKDSRLSCSDEGLIEVSEPSLKRMISQSAADKIQNLRIFSIFLAKCPEHILRNINRSDNDFPQNISKAIEGLTNLSKSYDTASKKQHKSYHVNEVIRELTHLNDKLIKQTDRAPYNLDTTARDFVLDMDGFVKDSSLDETDKFMKAHSTLSCSIEVLFPRVSFPKIYEVDNISGGIFPRWPRSAFIMWIILKTYTASPIKNYFSELANQYTSLQRSMQTHAITCDAFIEQRRQFAFRRKETTVVLDKSLFEQFFKDFLQLMEKAEKKASEQATQDNMTVKIGFAIFQLAGGVAAMASGQTPLQVIGNFASKKSLETLVAEMLKSKIITDNEVIDIRTALEKLMKEGLTNPAESMIKFEKAFTAEMEKMKKAHDAYEEMSKIFVCKKDESKDAPR